LTGSMTASLVTVAVLGLCFGPTRLFGIAATALLTLDRPWLVVVVVIVTAVMFHALKLRK
jgi:hypothetical protein